jgi:hypothetical protein
VTVRRGFAFAAFAAVVLPTLMAGCTSVPFLDSVGSKARDFVSAEKYTKLVVEVDWMEEGGKSYQPSALVLQALSTRLNERLSKPGGITVQLGNAIPATRQSYGPSELSDAEATHRSARSSGDTAAIWIVFATHSSSDSPSGKVVGIAYAGSSCAIFAASIEEMSTIFVTAESIERIAIVHEVGHLMGLVNGGTPMVVPHEDTDHPRHSTNPNSVMYWQVEGGGVVSLIQSGGAPDNFDANDIADLKAIGGK